MVGPCVCLGRQARRLSLIATASSQRPEWIHERQGSNDKHRSWRRCTIVEQVALADAVLADHDDVARERHIQVSEVPKVRDSDPCKLLPCSND